MIYRSLNQCTVREAPVGLFELECGEIICISEYQRNPGTEEARMAIIVSSGEYYHGKGDEALGWPLLLRAQVA